MFTHAPGCSLIIIGNCPHLEGWSVLQGSLCSFLGIVSVPCHKDVIHYSCPSLTAGENGWEQTGSKWSRAEMPGSSPAFS
jgi:hypothetical protein